MNDCALWYTSGMTLQEQVRANMVASMKAKEEPLIKFPHQYIVLGGLALLILLLALILKPKKN